MAHEVDEQVVNHHRLVCDQCGLVREFDIPVNESFTLADAGWLVFGHPDAGGGTVTFHTRRCAIGFFRAAVQEAMADQLGEEDGPLLDGSDQTGSPSLDLVDEA